MRYYIIGIEGWHAVESPRYNNSFDDVLVNQVVGGLKFSLKFKSDDEVATISKIWLGCAKMPAKLEHLLMTTSNNKVVPFELKSNEKVGFITFCVCVTSIRVKLSSRDKLYVKYKLFDNDSVCSSIITSSSTKFRKLFVCEITDRLVAGLRDEPLKVELWRKEVIENDVKIGNFSVDMSSLLHSRFQKHERCGGEVLNFYGRKIEDVRDTSARCYVSCTPGEHDIYFDEVVDIKSNSNCHHDTFTVSVMVENMMHIPTIEVDCFYFVSYCDAAGNKLKTKNVAVKPSTNQESVVWNEAKEIRLPVTLLSSRCNEKFKLCVMTSAYESNEDDDNCSVIGEAEVDVSLLMSSSFELVCGWYNVICRKTGCCNGQLKVSVAPTCNMSSINVQENFNTDFEIEKSLAPLPIVETPSRANCYVTGVDAPPKSELDGCGGEDSLCPDVSKVLQKKIKELEEVRKMFTIKINNLNVEVDNSDMKEKVSKDPTVDFSPLQTQVDLNPTDKKLEKENKVGSDADEDALLPQMFNIVTSSPNSSQLVDKNLMEETSLWSAGENCCVIDSSDRQQSASHSETKYSSCGDETVDENTNCDTKEKVAFDDDNDQTISTISQNKSDCSISFKSFNTALNDNLENKSNLEGVNEIDFPTISQNKSDCNISCKSLNTALGDNLENTGTLEGVNETKFEYNTAEKEGFSKHNVETKSNDESFKDKTVKEKVGEEHFNESSSKTTQRNENSQEFLKITENLENITVSENSFDGVEQTTSNNVQGLVKFISFKLMLTKQF